MVGGCVGGGGGGCAMLLLLLSVSGRFGVNAAHRLPFCGPSAVHVLPLFIPPLVLLLVLLLFRPAAMAAAGAGMDMQAALQVVVGGGQAPAAGEQAELANLEAEARDNAQRQRVLQRTGVRVAG